MSCLLMGFDCDRLMLVGSHGKMSSQNENFFTNNYCIFLSIEGKKIVI